MLSVRRLKPEEWRDYRDLRLRALAGAPDAFGSLLEHERLRADDHWEERVATAANSEQQCPVVAVDGRAMVGLAWGRIDPAHPGTAHIYQMWVDPSRRRLGAGAMLVGSIIEWARSEGAHRAELRVTEGDTPAARLYARAGFKPTGEFEPLRPGSSLHARVMRLDLKTR